MTERLKMFFLIFLLGVMSLPALLLRLVSSRRFYMSSLDWLQNCRFYIFKDIFSPILCQRSLVIFRRVVGIKLNCLDYSILAIILFKLIGVNSRLHLGVLSLSNRLIAHAWISNEFCEIGRETVNLVEFQNFKI